MKFYKDFIAPVLVLSVICLVISFGLVYTYQLTKPIIDAGAAKAADLARAEVLPEADAFDKLEISELPDGGLEAYQAKNGSGFVIVSQWKGYGGPIKVMTGIKSDGTISGMKVLGSNETPGLGTKVGEQSHLSKFTGKDMKLEGIESIGGATISSNALMNATKAAYKLYGAVAGVNVVGEEAREPITLEIMKKIFPEAKSFVRLDSTTEMYKVNEVGYIAVTSEDGFLGPIVTAVGMDSDGAIINIIVTQISESEEYGMQVVDISHLEQYIGKTSTEGVEAVSGSTVSSDALKKCVDSALEAFEKDKDAKEPIGSVKIKEALKTLSPDAEVHMTSIKGAKYAIKNDLAIGLVVETDGFAGTIEVIVVVDNDGKIVYVNLGKNSETEDYGAKATEESYRGQYTGKTSTEGIEAIGGATITSDAFKSAVEQALELVKGVQQ